MGAGSERRSRDLAVRVYRMSQSGLTTNEIADRVGKTSKQIKSLRELGERLLSADFAQV